MPWESLPKPAYSFGCPRTCCPAAGMAISFVAGHLTRHFGRKVCMLLMGA